jgi:excisionase family DNA binding protein
MEPKEMSINSQTQVAHGEKRRALSIAETAQVTGLSRASIYRLITAGKLKTVKVLGRRIVRPEAIEELLNTGAV